MSLPASQLKRADIIIECEQGEFFTLSNGRPWFRCRVEVAQFEENHRSMQTMGELLKARMFGSTEYAIGLRKRMTNYVSGEERRDKGFLEGAGGRPGTASPDPHPEHGVLCDCPDCDEAVKRLLRDCGILPKGVPTDYHLDYVNEWEAGRLRVPMRYRRDESDR